MAHDTKRSARPGVRRRLKNERRILDTALAIVTEAGFAGLSMNKLADACDYTPGALYRYFGSKDMLLSALVGRIVDQVAERIASGLNAARIDDPISRVRLITRIYERFAREQRHRFALIALAFAEPQLLLTTPASAQPVVQGMMRAMSPLAEALAAAQAAGALSEADPVQRTLVVFACTQGVLQMHKQARIAPGVINLEALGRETLRALLLGWGADPVTLELKLEQGDRVAAALENPAALEHTGDRS